MEMRLQCNRCKISWIPRIEGRPKWCPSCHSPYWDKERVRGVVKVAEPVKVSKPVPVAVPKAAPIISKPSGCDKHPNGGGWRKADGWWCVECGRIV